MPSSSAKRSIEIVSACTNANGCPDFALTVVQATCEENANGSHYDLAAAELMKSAFEPPFIHFDVDEAPAFLHPAVRHYLGLPPVKSEPASLNYPENLS